MAPPELLVNVDVPDLARAVAFYRDGLGLTFVRRLFGGTVAELAGTSARFFLLEKAAGTTPAATVATPRDYARHWTPVHLELAVDDVDAAVRRARPTCRATCGDASPCSPIRSATASA
jgi:catechol 2,3-dioxygenase-like lactoylglutathione lyase family enzyme